MDHIIVGLASGIMGSVIAVLGSRWIAGSSMKRQEREKERAHIQDQLGAYTSLWRFLVESNKRATTHPKFKKIKDCTHVLNSPADYEWLHNRFISTRLLSNKTYMLYLELLSKDNFGIAAMTDKPKLVPTNYTALQDEVKEMCDRLEEQLGQSTKRSP